MDQETARMILRQHGPRLFKQTNKCAGTAMIKQDGKFKLAILLEEKNNSHEHLTRLRFGDKPRLAKEGEKESKIDELEPELVVTGRIKAFVDRTIKHRPAYGGLSLGHIDEDTTAGTLGVVVYKSPARIKMILSNNHVLARQNDAVIGSPIAQPGMFDIFDHYEPYDEDEIEQATEENIIATLYDFVPILFYNFTGPWNYVDCAIARPLTGTPWVSGHVYGLYDCARNPITKLVYRCKLWHTSAAINKPRSGANWRYYWDSADVNETVLDIGLTGMLRDPIIGEEVTKTGRTTGRTEGVIWGFSSWIAVWYGEAKWAIFDDQIMTRNEPIAMGEKGDSGSLLVTKCGKKAVGLLFAGSSSITVFNRATDVAEGLGISFCPIPRLATSAGKISGKIIPADPPGTPERHKLCYDCCCPRPPPPPPPSPCWWCGEEADVPKFIEVTISGMSLCGCILNSDMTGDLPNETFILPYKVQCYWWEDYGDLFNGYYTVYWGVPPASSLCSMIYGGPYHLWGLRVSIHRSEFGVECRVMWYEPTPGPQWCLFWGDGTPAEDTCVQSTINNILVCNNEPCFMAGSPVPCNHYQGGTAIINDILELEPDMFMIDTIPPDKDDFCDELMKGDRPKRCIYSGKFVPPDFCRQVCKRKGAAKANGTIPTAVLATAATAVTETVATLKKKAGCCGGRVDKLLSIARGYGKLAGEKFFGLPPVKTAREMMILKGREAVCDGCEKLTYIGLMEYGGWLASNVKEVAKNIVDLSALPELPIYPKDENRTEKFCAVCKCYLPAKIRLMDEKCLLGKWLDG